MSGRAHAESARRVGDCVTALLRDQPFFGSLALRLPIRADASRETLASDGRDIRYAPGWVAETDADRIESYARYRLGLRRWHSVVGLRADERSRVLRMRARDCGSRTGARAVLPLADAGVAERDVLEWWKRQPFDLGIPSYAGNCVLCFLKGRAKLLRLIREDPSRADWWIEQERRVSTRTNAQGRACESMKRFRLGETYEELRAAPSIKPTCSTARRRTPRRATAPTDPPTPRPEPPGGRGEHGRTRRDVASHCFVARRVPI